MRTIMLALMLLLGCCVVSLHASPTAAAGATIDDLAWIAGDWRGELFGSHAEERWTEPEANHMIGVFRLWGDQGPRLYELCEIVQSEDKGESRIHLRFKHINAVTLKQWEVDRPLEFLLTKSGDQRAVFTATSEEQRAVTEMIYALEGVTLSVTVRGEHDNGESFEFVALYESDRD